MNTLLTIILGVLLILCFAFIRALIETAETEKKWKDRPNDNVERFENYLKKKAKYRLH